MERLGTNYGGWYVPINMNLNETSIIYSAGVGEDMSFDIILQDKYHSNIYLIDPTEKAIKHYYPLRQDYTHRSLVGCFFCLCHYSFYFWHRQSSAD